MKEQLNFNSFKTDADVFEVFGLLKLIISKKVVFSFCL